MRHLGVHSFPALVACSFKHSCADGWRLCALCVLPAVAVAVCRRDAATGELRIGIFTTRPVSELEELTYDYMFEHSGVGALARGFKCMCGAKNCRCG